MTNKERYIQEAKDCIKRTDVEDFLKKNKLEKSKSIHLGKIQIDNQEYIFGIRKLLTELIVKHDCKISDTSNAGHWQGDFLKGLFGDDFSILSTNKPDPIEEGQNGTYKMPLNQILYGPPGTGKTYNTINKALSIIENKPEVEIGRLTRKDLQSIFNDLKDKSQIEFITFHQSYAYEEFIEGIKPKAKKCDEEDDNKDISYCIKDGVFKRLADKARKNLESDEDTRNFALIIDEINRGNISKIFGELITLIEDSKRVGSGKEDTTAILPYSGEEFGVPSNLYIIGTMNTADRSIAHIDTALRRRFGFVEMMPNYEELKKRSITKDEKTINIGKLLEAMNDRIEVLYDREHTIGHAYFMDLDDSSIIDDLAHIFKNKIIPLLAEYFYSDWSKINLVFNDNKFISRVEKKLEILVKKYIL